MSKIDKRKIIDFEETKTDHNMPFEITKESKRYTNALPENYELKPQGQMRVLVLKYKENPKPITFNFKFADGSTYDVTF